MGHMQAVVIREPSNREEDRGNMQNEGFDGVAREKRRKAREALIHDNFLLDPTIIQFLSLDFSET